MVERIYVEKMSAFAQEAHAALADIRNVFGFSGVTGLRILNRYDVEGVDHALFSSCRYTVFAEPQTDITHDEIPQDADAVFAAEYLPGQFDQRAEACAQCIALLSQKDAPVVRTARVFLLFGTICETELNSIKRYIINPVEAREAALTKPESLALQAETPERIPVLSGFCERSETELSGLISEYGLAMDLLSGVFPAGAARSHTDRAETARHLLVGSLPTYDVSHRAGRGGVLRSPRAKNI